MSTTCTNSIRVADDQGSDGWVMYERTRLVSFVNPEVKGADDIVWQLQGDCRDRKGRKWWSSKAMGIHKCRKPRGKVHCPCTNETHPITKEKAYEKILGKLMSFPVSPSGTPRVVRKFDRLKMAVAFKDMLGCWTKRCAAGQPAHLNTTGQSLPTASLETGHSSALDQDSLAERLLIKDALHDRAEEDAELADLIRRRAGDASGDLEIWTSGITDLEEMFGGGSAC